MASPTSTNGAGVPPVLPSIPLAPEPVKAPADQSIGALVKTATESVSTLLRAEVELAKAEVAAEVKKGVMGSVFFVVAGVILLFSLFFLFFTFGELLSLWLNRAAAFAIVFGVMVVMAAISGLLGFLSLRKIRSPQRTIESFKESAAVLSSVRPHSAAELNGHSAH